MLTHCHQELSVFLPGPLESLQAARCVERHRLDWRPEAVHTILLAESHVFTSDSELLPMRGPFQSVGRALNRTFARFVYCLGYGESDFAGPSLPALPGTPQYWKLFASCVQPASAEAFDPLLKCSNRSFTDRLRAKVSLLERLRTLGVWLVDASAVALYAPGGSRLHQSAYERVLKCCWRAYTGHLVRAATPHSLIVVGKGVARALESELAVLTGVQVHCVSQPQGCRKPGTIDDVHATLYRVCQHAAYSRGVK